MRNAFLHILGEDITVEENTVSIQQYSEKPEELPLHQLRSKSGELVYNKLHLNDDRPSAAEECQIEETDLRTKPQCILHSSYYSSQ